MARACRFGRSIIYKIKKCFEVKKNKTFLELNGQIQKNFERMFNAKDKRIQLTENYEIQMLYPTDVGFREEKNLSEGEKSHAILHLSLQSWNTAEIKRLSILEWKVEEIHCRLF